jgi:hypothetical protein
VRSIRIKPEKGLATIDKVLGNDPGHQGLPNAAFFAAYKMDVCHEIFFENVGCSDPPVSGEEGSSQRSMINKILPTSAASNTG